MKTEIIKITDTAYGGSGVGRNAEGKAVFVPFTVTGDIVSAKTTQDKGSYETAELVEVKEPSPLRTEPRCIYHGVCGGCHFGHIRYDKQLEIKENILKQALRNHPQKTGLPEIAVFTGKTTDYRIRANVRALNGNVGFYKGGSNKFVPVKQCPAIKHELFSKCAAWAEKYSPDTICSLSVVENPIGEAIALIEGKGSLPCVNTEKPFDGVKCGAEQYGIKHLPYKTPFGVAPVGYGGFFQSNIFLNDIFQKYAAESATGQKILELYAGSGFFTSALAKKADVFAVEANAEAALLGQKYGYPINHGHTASAEIKKGQYDTVFADPPREGMDKKTISALMELAPDQIIYVSCNPMTLARDLNRLSGKYAISATAIFDLFPDTYHIETVVLLEQII
ncbi:MAG: TRAM domain-containing protein [Deferribacteraceae bacterium]|jgi:23S rRNA (uracil1939-C5)-methyltransferase|nr:TRAM domain-containing protein [Deferribacteraceae bacterium]